MKPIKRFLQTIKKFKNISRRQRLSLVLPLSIFLIAVSCVITFSVVMYNNAKNAYVKNVDLLQTNTMLSYTNRMHDYSKSALSLINDKSVYNFLSNQITDLSYRYSVASILTDLKKEEYLNNIILLDVRHEVVLDWASLTKLNLSEYISQNEEFASVHDNSVNNGLYTPDNSDNVYFCYHDYRNYNVYFSLPKSVITSNIFGFLNQDEYSSTIYYKNVPILTYNDKDNFYESTSAVFNVDEKVNNRIYTNDNSVYLYKKSDNITLVTGAEKSSYLSFIYKYIASRWSVYLLMVLISLSCIIIISKITSKINSEASNEIEESKSLTKEMQKHDALLKCFLHDTLYTWEKNLLTDDLFPDYKGNIVYALFLNISTSSILPESFSKNDIPLIKLGICNIINEMCTEDYSSYAINLYENGIGIILTSCNKNFQIKKYISEIRKNIGIAYDLSFCISISDIIENTDALIEAASSTIILNSYSFFCGLNSDIYSGSDITNGQHVEYPTELQQKIINDIRLKDEKAFEKDFNKFVTIIHNSYDLNTISWMYTLLISITNQLDIKNISLFSNLIKDLSNKETLSQSAKYVKNIVHQSFDNNDNDDGSTDLYFSEIVEKEIQENYSNPDFCLQSIAEKLNISTIYAGRKFKRIFDRTFNIYIAEYRIQASLDMLKDSNIKIMDIAAKCGFNSSTYFITTFKKYRNMTPQQYRTLSISSQNQ